MFQRRLKKKRRKSVYKPGFVRHPGGRRDDHFSRKSIARFLQQSTRKSMAGRTDPLGDAGGDAVNSAHAPCLTLLPVGFTEPGRSPGLLVSSYLTVSPLPRGPKPARRFAFCCTFPDLSAGGRYPSLRPTEPGLSSRPVLLGADKTTPFGPDRRSSDRLPNQLTIDIRRRAGKGGGLCHPIYVG